MLEDGISGDPGRRTDHYIDRAATFSDVVSRDDAGVGGWHSGIFGQGYVIPNKQILSMEFPCT